MNTIATLQDFHAEFAGVAGTLWGNIKIVFSIRFDFLCEDTHSVWYFQLLDRLMYETTVSMYEFRVLTQRRRMPWERSQEILLFVESNPVGTIFGRIGVDVDGVAIFVSVP